MTRNASKTDGVTEQPDGAPPRKPISRRAWIGVAGGVAAVFVGRRFWPRSSTERESGLPLVTVYRSPLCECCGKWIAAMNAAGFRTTEVSMDDVTPVKRARGVPDRLFSCHTADVEGFVVEGHVPPDLVARMLREHPDLLGLAVPGMPQSAPGMDLGHVPYDVLSFTRSGETAVYAKRS